MPNKPLYIMLGVLFLVLIISIGGVIYLKNHTSTTTVPINQQQTTNLLPDAKGMVLLSTKITTDDKGQVLEVWLDPSSLNELNLTSLALKAEFYQKDNQGLTTSAIKPSLGPFFLRSDWRTAFAKLDTQSGKVNLEMSLVSLSTQPYALSQPVLLSSFPIKASSGSISVQIDPEVSKLYDKSGDLFGFSSAL